MNTFLSFSNNQIPWWYFILIHILWVFWIILYFADMDYKNPEKKINFFKWLLWEKPYNIFWFIIYVYDMIRLIYFFIRG